MAPSRRIAAIVAVTALAMSACSSNDADREDIEEAMRDAGLPDEQAGCIAERLDEELDQDQLNDLAGAADPDEFSEDGADAVSAAVDECVDGSTAASRRSRPTTPVTPPSRTRPGRRPPRPADPSPVAHQAWSRASRRTRRRRRRPGAHPCIRVARRGYHAARSGRR
jgi:hypothetical protein